jgi:hypothetical protein
VGNFRRRFALKFHDIMFSDTGIEYQKITNTS